MYLKTLRFRAGGGWLEPLPTTMDGPRTLVLAFGASAFAEDTAPLTGLAQAFPASVLLGCSTSGEIAGAQVHDDGISLAVVRFERTELRRAAAEVQAPDDAWSAGARLAQALQAPGLRAVFLLGDGLNVDGSALVAGLAQNLGEGVAVCGGLAGDGRRFVRTWVLDAGGRPAQRQVAAVGLYGGRLRFGHGCGAGGSGLGPEWRITRSEGRVLHELDGRPALDLYEQPLGGHAGDMPQGDVARPVCASPEQLIGGAGEAVARATRHLRRDEAPLLVSVSCASRRLMLGERTKQEVQTVVDGAPCRAGHVGFYSHGAIAPAHAGGATDLHHQTMTVTAIGEDAD